MLIDHTTLRRVICAILKTGGSTLDEAEFVTDENPPFVLDMAMSHIATGKARVAMMRGEN